MDPNYYGLERADLLPLVPESVSRLLDVGCGEGGFGALIRRYHPDVVVHGIETASHAAEKATTHYQRVFTGAYPDVLRGSAETYDLIAFNDVLEHMVDPWGALSEARRFLAPSGHIIVSLPNLANLESIAQLIRGRFDYAESGVLDRTHLRFFTVKTARELVIGAGFVIEKQQFHWPVLRPTVTRFLGKLGYEALNHRQVGFRLAPRQP